MHLTRETLNVWAEKTRADLRRPGPAEGYTRLIRLEEGDSMWRLGIQHADIEGPAIVELVVYRDGGWSAREMVYETPESIALTASLAQRAGRTIGLTTLDPDGGLR